MQIQEKKIQDLIADPRNARSHDTKNLQAIEGSLQVFGQQKPIVVTEDNRVIAGNATVEAAKSLGWEEIKVVVTTLEGQEVEAFGLADNRTAELAAWNYPVLGELVQELQAQDFDLEQIGWSDYEIEPLLQADWQPPELSAMPGTGNNSDPDYEMATPIAVTTDQRVTVDRAVERVREEHGADISEGRCIELICAEYLA